MTSPREFDVVLFGASGFTGRVAANYLASSGEKPRWAIAGRNRAKLEALGLDVPIVVADSLDRDAVAAAVRRTTVACTAAGPYAQFGSELVGACADAGTHYCDLTGEVHWMRRMIDTYDARARASGARIVHAAGFDSVPSDLGTWAVQQEFFARHGRFAERVTALFGESHGGVSGGTIASAIQTAIESSEDPAVAAVLADTHALDPDPTAGRTRDPDETRIGWDPHWKLLTAPFVMAQVNTRVVRRSHALAGLWGPGFRYREVMSASRSPRGLATAVASAVAVTALPHVIKQPWLRGLVARRAPQPGEGPSRELRSKGYWKARFVAEAGSIALLYEIGDRLDPGHGSTSKMLCESALCLARDPLVSKPGVTTPSLAMGQHLLDRLRRAGQTFQVAEP